MSRRAKGPAVAAAAAAPSAPKSPPGPQPLAWQAPVYRPAGRPLLKPLGSPPEVELKTPATEAAAETFAAAAPVRPPSPPPPMSSTSAELEPSGARPRQWGPPLEAPREGMGNAAHATNGYAERIAERDTREWYKAKEVPQSETLLVHAWVYALSRCPAQAMTVWLFRTDPAPPYEFSLDGSALLSDWPDRKIYDEVARKRRQPAVAERFMARIRGRFPDGRYAEIATGEIYLPPEPAQGAATPWAGASAAPWAAPPYGAPPGWPGYGYGPPGYPAPYGAAPPYGAPPGYASPAGGPWWPQAQQPAPGQSTVEKLLVDVVTSGKGSPEMVGVLKTMLEVQRDQASAKGESQSEMMSLLLKNALERKEADPFERLASLMKLARELQPPAPEPRGGITIHNVDGGKMVEDRNGDLDVSASIGLSVLPLVGDVVKKRFASAAAPKPSGPPVQPGAGPSVAKAPPPGPAPLRMNGTAH